MVSMLPDGFDEKQQRQKGDPLSRYFAEVKDLARADEFNCLLRNQQHYYLLSNKCENEEQKK